MKPTDNELIQQILLENLPQIIAIYDTTGRFMYANEHTDFFFRMPKGGVTGKSFREMFPAQVADEQEKTMISIITSKKPVNLERSMMMHGQMNYFKATHQPLLDEKGEVRSILVIGQNITSQVQHEKLLKIQHQIDSLSNLTTSLTLSLKKAFSYMLEIDWIDVGGIYLFDEDRKHLRLVYSEGLSETYLKAVSVYSDNDPQTKLVLKKKSKFASSRTFLRPINEIMLKEHLTYVVAIPLVYKKEVIGSLNVGSKSVEEVSPHDKYIIESIASRLANLIILVKTRDELIASNLRLNRSVQEIGEQQQLLIQKSRLESLGELSAGLAHEINQPLSVISLVMENINYKMEQNAASAEYLSGKFQTISQNINKIRKLIDHVRIFSRDQGAIMFERVDVNQVIRDALSMIEAQLRSHRINLVVNLTEGLGYTLGNPARFEQVILNLVSNARDALDDREKMALGPNNGKEIVVTTFMEKDRIYIIIRDNGSGIPKDNLDKIFNPFFTTKSEGRGTGLGLAIVYGIIGEMKGDISVVSEEMAFTEIRLKLKGYKNQPVHSNSS